MAHHRRKSKRADADRARVQTAILRGSLQSHIKSLGLTSQKEYQDWCRTRGFSEGLHKSDEQKRKELRLAKVHQGESILARKRSQTRNPGNTIRQLYDRAVPKGRLGADYLYRIRSLFHALEDDPPSRRALFDILLAVENSGKLFGLDAALPYRPEDPQNTFLQGLMQLARRHRDFVRAPSDWQPLSRNSRRQFGQLARHLLAEYPDVPDFLDAAWIGPEDENHQRWQEWFIHLGTGANVRTASDIPIKLTKSMAHELLQTPELTPIPIALRRAQILGQGGWDSLVHALCQTQLGNSFEHEHFWSTVITFFLRHPMLDPAHVGPIVDYLQQQKFDGAEILQPGGALAHEPPAQPNLSMKSRSIDKLLRQVDDWHEELAQAEIGRAAQADAQHEGRHSRSRRQVRFIEFVKGSIGDFEVIERVGKQRTMWRIRRLRNNADLAADGRAMHHCVLTYAKSCRKGDVSIWSLTASEDGGSPRPVLTIAMSGSRAITQARGRHNAQPWGKNRGNIEHSYASLLTRGAAIMERWIKREKLVWGEVRI
ncbi:MAG: hypothetical protein HOM31_16540 [Gemmatimonadetes bacterium]|nr:hypothetical protein [Gemmatimonadota bacterium]